MERTVFFIRFFVRTGGFTPEQKVDRDFSLSFLFCYRRWRIGMICFFSASRSGSSSAASIFVASGFTSGCLVPGVCSGVRSSSLVASIFSFSWTFSFSCVDSSSRSASCFNFSKTGDWLMRFNTSSASTSLKNRVGCSMISGKYSG